MRIPRTTTRKKSPWKRPGLKPTIVAPRGALKPCVACGGLIRWALKSCFDCNRVLVSERPIAERRFLYFT